MNFVGRLAAASRSTKHSGLNEMTDRYGMSGMTGMNEMNGMNRMKVMSGMRV